ncbi:MAG TPA: 2-phospho-L-lactate guanylyltransferase [Promineifilum sp.]|nr:2-phospho-L-lactate guanylyltransferase [Promineifilum sp.]
MTTWAIIPVKPLYESKRRLAHLLSAGARAELIHHFLDNLLATLNKAPGIDRVLVVTGDAEVTALAESHGAAVLVEAESRGLNEAATRGIAPAARQGVAAVLILPADLPFARVEDIEQMLRPLDGGYGPLLALTGDEAEDGTNALLLAPPGDFTFRYGPGSYRAHLDEAAARGRTIHIINAPGLRFDLDTESDWLAYCDCLIQVVDE